MSRASSSRPAIPRRTALLVMAPTDLRRLLVRGFRQRGLKVQAFDEPFAATDGFARKPTDLVFASLGGFGPGDEEFFDSLGRRAPATRLVAFVGEDEHETGRLALYRGAHAWLPEPRTQDDVQAVLHAVDRWFPDEGRDILSVFAPLAAELAHLFGNRLTSLMNLPELVAFPPELAKSHKNTIAQFKEATRRLGRLQELPEREPARVELRKLVDESLDVLVSRKTIRAFDFRARASGTVHVDRAAVRLAVEAAGDALVGLAASEEPVRLEVAVKRPRLPYEPLLSSPPLRPALLEVRLRVPGLQLDRAALRDCHRQVLWRQDRTGRVHWGLWIPEEIVRRDQGVLIVRQGLAGAGVGFVFRRA